MRHRILPVALLLALSFGAGAVGMGCAGLVPHMPPDHTVDENGVVTPISLEDQLGKLEAEVAQARLTIAELEASAGFLPPPFNVIALGALTTLAGVLEQQRRKLRAELIVRDATDKALTLSAV